MPEVMPTAEVIYQLQLDRARRCTRKYRYACCILDQNSIVPDAIWPLPNAYVERIIRGEISRSDLVLDDEDEHTLNAFHVGMCFKELRTFIASQVIVGTHMLCETLQYQPCLQERCPIFVPPGKLGGQFGICREYKIAFPNDLTFDPCLTCERSGPNCVIIRRPNANA